MPPQKSPIVISHEVIGIPNLKDRMRHIGKNAKAAVKKAIRSGTLDVQFEAKRRATGKDGGPRVRTGNLRRNILVNFYEDGLVGECTSYAHYTKALEYGTKNTRAYPFMHPAAETVKPRCVAQIRAAMKEATK